MALPKEPRQKMINIMYLVLTALLALNVSAEILNAFKTVDRSLTTTNRTINLSTQTIIASFKEKATQSESAEKAKMWMPKAEQAVALTESINSYIDGIKRDILKAADFDPVRKGDSTFKEDNQDIATRMLVEENRGKELFDKLTAYKAAMISLGKGTPEIEAQITNFVKQIDLSIPPSNHGSENWQAGYFRMVPTVAAITMLSKFQNDVKTTENRTVSLFHEQVGKVQVRFDTYTAIVGQSSNYVMPGGEIDVMAGVGAFSKAAKPIITINGQSVALGEDGAAHLKIGAGALGKHSVPVSIRYVDQENKPQTINKTIDYTVGQANASIALDKMNVLYMGIANPVTVAASGGGDDRIQVSISGGGRLDKTGAGKYNAFVNGGDKCTITVSVDGKVAGASEFRIRRIPTPTATVGGEPSGANMNAGNFRSQAGVGAYIKDFPFDLSYTVTGFVVSTDSDDGDIVEARVTGNSWNDEVRRKVLPQIKSGKTVYLDEIRATGPDGQNKKLPSLVYYIK